MRGCATFVLWALFAVLFMMGGCAVCVIVTEPRSQRMLGCTDCDLLVVGQPDAPEWAQLVEGEQYVLAGCHQMPDQPLDQDWRIVGDAWGLQTNPHRVAVRLEYRDDFPRPPISLSAGECYRVLVSYEPEHESLFGMLTFVAHDTYRVPPQEAGQDVRP